jgi:hypothetical protein
MEHRDTCQHNAQYLSQQYVSQRRGPCKSQRGEHTREENSSVIVRWIFGEAERMPWINGSVDKQNTRAGEFLCTIEFIGKADSLLEQLIREFRSEDISALLNEESKHRTECD